MPLTYGNITRWKNYTFTGHKLPLMMRATSVCAFCSPERRAFEVDAAMSLIAGHKRPKWSNGSMDEKGKVEGTTLASHRSAKCQQGRQFSEHCFRPEAPRHLVLIVFEHS